MGTTRFHTGLRSAAAVAGVAAAMTVLTPAAAGAVSPHQHSLTNPAGTHDIAGGFCNGNFAVGTPQNAAITNFHGRIHVGTSGPDGVVTIGGGPCA